MKIIECCPFFKEHLIADLHIRESIKWVDEIHITEADRTFQNQPKEFNFPGFDHPKVHYHQLQTQNLFLPSRSLVPHLRMFNKPGWHNKIFRKTSWYNDGMQRIKSVPDFSDDDILVLGDIDEIIDPSKVDRIIEEVKKRDIITIKLHFTLFYFNLFSENWGGPPDYSYRLFVVKGKTFRKMWNSDYDTLRKAGERLQLLNSVYCLDDFGGFHHSWLGDEAFISDKLAAYAHLEHTGYNNMEYIKNQVRTGKSIFRDHKLKIDNTIPLLSTIQNNREKYKNNFISEG